MHAVLHSYAYSLDYLRGLLSDLSEEEWVAQPSGFSNHPAWTIGHLTYSCQAMGGELELAPWLPDAWRELFGPGSVPRSRRADYPASHELLAALADGQGKLCSAVKLLGRAELDAPLPDARFRELLPSLRHALTQVLVGHTAYHVGQLAAWRIAIRKPPLGQSFV